MGFQKRREGPFYQRVLLEGFWEEVAFERLVEFGPVDAGRFFLNFFLKRKFFPFFKDQLQSCLPVYWILLVGIVHVFLAPH